MRDDGDGGFGAVSDDDFGSFDECAARVGHVVHDDGDAVAHVAYEDHTGDFVGAGTLFVDEGEAEVEAVGYGCCSGVSGVNG